MKTAIIIIDTALIYIFFNQVCADTIVTKNGTKIIGDVKTITNEVIQIHTEFAGIIEVKQDHLEQLTSDSILTSKLKDGTTVTGTVNIDSQGKISVKNKTLSLQTSRDKLMAAWRPNQPPPDEAGYKKSKKWTYSISADITGKQGNSKEMGAAFQATATLADETDKLKFKASLDRAEKNGTKTSNEMIFGASYVTYMYDPWGWYVEGEVEKDEFESIDLRTTMSGGLSYRVIHNPDHELELNSGFGYRYESFKDGTHDASPVIDFGLDHSWHIQPWLAMTNSLKFRPAMTDFSDYLLTHDSGFNIPIALGNWNLRIGLKNDYKSRPATGKKRLDTTYYTRILMNY